MLLASLAAFAILTVGTNFLLQYQTRRNASSLLARAAELEKTEQYQRAAGYLHRYLLLRPDDATAYVRLAMISDKEVAGTRSPHERNRIVRLYLHAIGVVPTNQSAALRKRVCELLLEQESFSVAESQATALVKSDPEDPSGWRLLAISIYGKLTQRSFVKTGDVRGGEIGLGRALERSLQLDPYDVKIAGMFAEVYRTYPEFLSADQQDDLRRVVEAQLTPQELQQVRQLPEIANLSISQAKQVRMASVELQRREQRERVRRADQIFEAMLEQRPENALVWAARFDYRRKYQVPGASADLKQALELSPQDPRLLLIAGQHAQQQAESTRGEERQAYLHASRQYFQNIISGHDPALLSGHDPVERHFSVEQQREQTATLKQAYLGLGQVAMLRNDPGQAIHWFREGSLGVGKEDIRFQLYLADAMLMAGQPEAAEAQWKQGVAQTKEKMPTLRPRAQRALRRSSALVRGKLYLNEGKWMDAIREFNGIVQSNEESASAGELTCRAYNLIGTTYARMEQWDLAGTAFEQSLQVRSNQTDAMHGAIVAWESADQPQRVVDLYAEFLPEQSDFYSWLTLAEAHLRVQQRLSAAERNWLAFQNSLTNVRELHSPEDQSQACRLLLLETEHALTRQDELLAQPAQGRVLFSLPVVESQTPWIYRESHAAFLNKLFPDLEAGSECLTILRQLAAAPGRESAQSQIRKIVHQLALVSLRRSKDWEILDNTSKLRICLYLEHLSSPEEADDFFNVRNTQPSAESKQDWLLQIRLSIRRGELESARSLIQDLPIEWTSADKRYLEDLQIQFELQEGSERNIELAKQILLARHHDHPFDTHVVWQLALIAFREQNSPEVQRLTELLQRLEGESGTLWMHIELLRLLAPLESDSKLALPDLSRAQQLASQLVEQRPHWREGWIQSARLAKYESQWKEAADAYQTAIHYGAREPEVYRELIAILFRLGEYQQASRYLERIRPEVGASASWSTLAMSASAMLGENGHALEIAQQNVRDFPDDSLAWLWLSRMQGLNQLPAEAKVSILKARELAPQDVRIAYAHFAYCVENGQLDEARQLLQTLGENSTFDNPAELFLIEARGYEALGEEAMAEGRYLQAAELIPGDISVQLQTASFFLARTPPRAKKHLRSALEIEPDNQIARRNLASLLLAEDTKQSWAEAQDLVDPQDRSALGRRLQAILLLRQPSETLDSSRQILERLVASHGNDTDRFLLAEVYLLESALLTERVHRELRLKQARTHYQYFASKQPARPEHVLRFVEFLLRYQSRDEARQWLPELRKAILSSTKPETEKILEYIEFLVDAEYRELAAQEIEALTLSEIESDPKWLGRTIDLLLRLGKSEQATSPLERLRELQPKSFSTIVRQGRWLSEAGRHTEVPTWIEPFVDRWIARQGDQSEHAELSLRTGKLYAELGMDEAAEHWFKRLLQYDPSQYEPLAKHLAGQGRWSELLKFFEQRRVQETDARYATVLARCLSLNRPDSPTREMILQRIEKGLTANLENLELLLAMGELYQGLGDWASGVEIYQRALRISPDHVEALRELAQCQSQQTDSLSQSRALNTIHQAIRIAGPSADFLAIKGMIYVYSGHAEEGVDLLRFAASTIPPDPLHQFYYALVLTELSDAETAKSAWQKIDQNKLVPVFNSDPRVRFQKLQKQQGKP